MGERVRSQTARRGGLPHRLVLGHGRRSWQLISVIDLPDERGREGVLVLLEPGPAQRPR